MILTVPRDLLPYLDEVQLTYTVSNEKSMFLSNVRIEFEGHEYNIAKYGRAQYEYGCDFGSRAATRLVNLNY